MLMILDTKLDFGERMKNVLSKVNKIVGLFRKLQNIFPRDISKHLPIK